MEIGLPHVVVWIIVGMLAGTLAGMIAKGERRALGFCAISASGWLERS